MHITLRRLANLPSFRQQRVGTLMLRQMRRLNDAELQIVHFSIQGNHVHLIVEAKDRETVTRKMRGFAISWAKCFNRDVARRKRGKVWADRYYRRDVVSARAMNTLLRYVFGNAKKHGEIPRDAARLDTYSTAWTFDGWDVVIRTPENSAHWPRPHPWTRLLRIDWIGAGLLPIAGAPRSEARFASRHRS